MNKFLVGNILREVKNGRLNCSNAKNEQASGDMKNMTYVKKIRRGKDVYPYAAAQNQKKAMKNFVASQGFDIAFVKSASSTEAVSEGNPYKNYDEDIMGFMNAKAIKLTKEEFDELDEKERKGFNKKGKTYEKNITKKRRANLMMSPLQAIKHTKITQEFSTRETDSTPLLYTKEVYSAHMSSGLILDITQVGHFKANDNETGYRDYAIDEIEPLSVELDENDTFELTRDEKLSRINITLDALRIMNSKTTMTNNLEDLSAKFIILAEYKIGNAIFNNIFEDGELKIDYLKQAIDENDIYRISKIYIGCRDQYFKQDDKFLKEVLEYNFGKDDRIVIGEVKGIVDKYKEYLSETL